MSNVFLSFTNAPEKILNRSASQQKRTAQTFAVTHTSAHSRQFAAVWCPRDVHWVSLKIKMQITASAKKLVIHDLTRQNKIIMNTSLFTTIDA